MNRVSALFAAVLALVFAQQTAAQAPDDASSWTLYITNDNCPDYTWGFTEEQTRQAFADIVRAHLDEMNRTDGLAPENRDRYNMAVTQEALCFVERYPDRKSELIRRIKEGRMYVSPYLCNTLWAFQSVEGSIRAFYPARRLEREWGIPMDVAEHIEEPSLPWSVASILAGCGVRWLSNPFYAYDSTFRGLKNPPFFIYEGPDGGRIRVVMDPWASQKASYTQGRHLLRDTKIIMNEWLPHYRQLGESYPIRAILASGTHGDINPGSGRQARGFAEGIIKYNAGEGPHPKLVNATLPQFCKAVDQAEARSPFLQTIRGSFGHSWDLWPVSLAKYVADMREGERAFLAAEALLAVACRTQPKLHEATRADRERAEWCWAMLGDHAWNGTDDKNKKHNAELRRKWSEELNALSKKSLEQGWAGIGVKPNDRCVTIFNSLSIPRADLVRIEAPAELDSVVADGKTLAAQIVEEDGRRILYFVSPIVPGFGLAQLELRATGKDTPTPPGFVHKAGGSELFSRDNVRTLLKTVYFDGQEHSLTDVEWEDVTVGPVLRRRKITGVAAGIRVTGFMTGYQALDRVDFDLRIHKPVTTVQERLCQVFPDLRKDAVVRIETPGAVIRPRPQPEGDLLPGADTRRFAVQGFVDASSPDGPGVTIAPLDAYALRLDLEPLTLEALGNDQNYREVTKDQNGETEFRFRYSMRWHTGPYNNAETSAWSRSVATPLLATLGSRGSQPVTLKEGGAGSQPANPPVVVDPTRAIATCLKPADGDSSDGLILRLWETGGQSGPLAITLSGFRRAFRTDLLERNFEPLPIENGKVTFPLPAHGFGALRLLP
jgi:hypothetical protein